MSKDAKRKKCGFLRLVSDTAAVRFCKDSPDQGWQEVCSRSHFQSGSSPELF
jgi:hypothetical protein